MGTSFGSDAGSMAPEGNFIKQSAHPRAHMEISRALSGIIQQG
jgi:hypothetical protein